MAKVIKGSAVYTDDGACIFTPYEEGKPENVTWIQLASADCGKLDCSKKKVRVVLCMDRTSPDQVVSKFIGAIGKLIREFNNPKIQSLYNKAATMKPCEIEAPQPPKGEGMRKEDEIPMFP